MTALPTHSELRAELSALERSMRELLAAVESPSSNLDSITRSMQACDSRTPNPATVRAIRERCSSKERVELDTTLHRLVDLNVILRETTARATALTSMALEKTQAIKRSLGALENSGSDESTLDCQS